MKIFNHEFNLDFIKSVYSEPDGSGSCSRILMSCIVAFVLGVGSALAYKVHTPITVEEFNSFLTSAGIFITTTAGPMYLINKGTDILKNNSNNNVKIPVAPQVTVNANMDQEHHEDREDKREG